MLGVASFQFPKGPIPKGRGAPAETWEGTGGMGETLNSSGSRVLFARGRLAPFPLGPGWGQGEPARVWAPGEKFWGALAGFPDRPRVRIRAPGIPGTTGEGGGDLPRGPPKPRGTWGERGAPPFFPPRERAWVTPTLFFFPLGGGLVDKPLGGPTWGSDPPAGGALNKIPRKGASGE